MRGKTMYGILGALEVRIEGGRVEIRRSRLRSLLAALLLRARDVVPATTLVDDLWGPAAPPSADALIRLYVSQLRRLLGSDAIVTQPPGYFLPVDADAL